MSYEIGPTKASDQLGVPITTLYTWRNKLKKHGNMAFVGSGHQRLDSKTAEVKALEKKLKEFESANDILKKALGFFAENRKTIHLTAFMLIASVLYL